MGMFDSVFATCPACKQGEIEFQSKAGPCVLASHSLDAVPLVIAADIAGDTSQCRACGSQFTIMLPFPQQEAISMVLT
jgi:hypothetical protein